MKKTKTLATYESISLDTPLTIKRNSVKKIFIVIKKALERTGVSTIKNKRYTLTLVRLYNISCPKLFFQLKHIAEDYPIGSKFI